MLFFNLETLESNSKSPEEFYSLFKEFYKLKTSGVYGPKLLKTRLNLKKLTGNSFLVNERPILFNIVCDVNYLVQYIKLAGYRDYTLYKQFGYKDLDISFFPDLNVTLLKHNPILTLTDNKTIRFKYEYGN